MAQENWFLQIARNGIHPTHEANTSRHVHELLMKCLGWPFESIEPQASRRGYIDYNLRFRRPETLIHVEVKKFGLGLKQSMIADYLDRRAFRNQDLVVGVLTNLQTWAIYVSGAAVRSATGKRIACVREIEISSRRDIYDLDNLIGYRVGGQMREIRAAFADFPDVIERLLWNQPKVHGVVRKRLRRLLRRKAPDVRLPQTTTTKRLVKQLFNGRWDKRSPFKRHILAQVLRSGAVAGAADDWLTSEFGARGRQNAVRATIRDSVSVSRE